MVADGIEPWIKSQAGGRNPLQCIKVFALLRNQQLRIADNVDEQDMPDL